MPRTAPRHHTPLLSQSVDEATRRFREHAEKNCKVFKSYALQQLFWVSPNIAERLQQPETRVQTAGHGEHTAEEEAVIDAELVQLQELVHAVGTHRCVGYARGL